MFEGRHMWKEFGAKTTVGCGDRVEAREAAGGPKRWREPASNQWPPFRL